MAETKAGSRGLKLAACLLGMIALVAGVFFLTTGGRESSARGLRDEARAAKAPAPIEADETLADTDSIPSEPAPTSVTREVSTTPVEPNAPSAWRGELAGLIGRVVESDGRPVPGMRVALLEADATFLFDGDAIDADPPRLELEETATDREGRFVLSGARGQAFHGLGLDLGGPRASVRVLDNALVHGERTDIGDVVLPPFGVLTGRVIDEHGAPLAGARVRFGPYPPEVLQISPQEFRADSLIALGSIPMGGQGAAVLEIPDWVRRTIDRFPVPTTQSAEDGTFRLEGVALAPIVGGVDKAGYVGVTLGPFDMAGGEHDAGAITLARGRTVRGTVEDGFGEAVAGVEVFAGAELFPGMAAILQPCGKTDDEGRFELTGVPQNGQIIAAARRARHEPWSLTTTARNESVLIEIEAEVQLIVDVKDESGAPLAGARVRVSPGRQSSSVQDAEGFLAVLPRPSSAPDVFSEFEPGRYVCKKLGGGIYDVLVHAPGLAPAFAQASCLAAENEVTVVCAAGRRVELSVIDAVTKAPIAGARASLLRMGTSGFHKLALEKTDAQGHAALGPVGEAAASQQAFMPSETMLLVQHPRYGDHSADLRPEQSSLVVELEPGGALAGRVHWGGATPTRLYMLVLQPNTPDVNGFLEAFHMPRFGVTDLAGEFKLQNLAPGEYKVELDERFLNQDPFGLMNDEFRPVTVYEGKVEIKNGETTELVIDLTPTGRGATARIVGRVRVDGHGVEGAEVSVQSNEKVQLKTDASGRFETEPFAISESTWVHIEGEVELAGSKRQMELFSDSLELTQDEVHEINVDLYPVSFRVQVVDAESDKPVAGADVSAHGIVEKGEEDASSDSTNTNDSGEATLAVTKAGKYSLGVNADGFGGATQMLDVPAEGLSAITTIRLKHAVPCSGRVQFDAADPNAPARPGYLQVTSVDGSGYSSTRVMPPDYTFDLDNLGPGKHRALLYASRQRFEPIEFELGADGERDLVLRFQPAVDPPRPR